MRKLRFEGYEEYAVSHDFEQFDVVCRGASGLIQAAIDGEHDCRGVVLFADSDYFYVIESGLWGFNSHGKSSGLWYVDSVTEGLLTQTPPGGSSLPIMDVLDANTIMVLGV
jgi:hypothetical protein